MKTELTAEQVEEIQRIGSRVGMAILRGNRSLAHELVDQAVAARAAADKPAILETPLAEIGIDNRSCNALENVLGILTLDGLLKTDLAELLAVPTFGYMSILSMFAKTLSFTINHAIGLERIIRGIQEE